MARETEIIHEDEFQEMLTSAVADAVTRATEATVARITALESELATTKTRLQEAERRLEDLDQSRRNCVIISGIPETDGERTYSLACLLGLQGVSTAEVILRP